MRSFVFMCSDFEKLMADAVVQHEAERKAERELKIAAGESLEEEEDKKADDNETIFSRVEVFIWFVCIFLTGVACSGGRQRRQ